MKKLTSIILILAILYSCLTLVGCGVRNPQFVVYTRDESVTDRDVEFLESLCDVQLNKHSNYRYRALGDIPELHEYHMYDCDKLFWIENDFDSAYYLCLYTYDDFFKSISMLIDDIFGTELSAKYFTWYRFDDIDHRDIPRELDGQSLDRIYFLCDSVIKRDLSYGVDYNIGFTFYFPIGFDSFEMELPLVRYYAWEDMLCYRSSTIIEEHLDGTEYLFMTSMDFDHKSHYVNDTRLYTDENGDVYLALYTNTTNDDKLKYELYSLYEALSPYFVRLYDLEPDESKYYHGTYQVIGIKIDIFEEIAFGSKQD